MDFLTPVVLSLGQFLTPVTTVMHSSGVPIAVNTAGKYVAGTLGRSAVLAFTANPVVLGGVVIVTVGTAGYLAYEYATKED